MIEIEEALSLILGRATPRPPVERSVAELLGLVLAEDVASDIDSPPYDKALMDGYAVVASDLADGTAELRVLEELTAGVLPRYNVQSGSATRIMTGAPLPGGADAVAIMESTESFQRDATAMVRIRDAHVTPGSNILRRGASLRRGDRVLAAGTVLAPADIGVLAEAGRHRVQVHPPPTVAVVATGDELVACHQMPGPGQIRNSNGPMLSAQVASAGGVAIDLGIAPDEPDALSRQVRRGLQHDVLILSGGVSMGVRDLVPEVLADAGVEPVFHKVRVKPGKPMWFGVAPAEDGPRLVFGLPGNPVSSLVCCELFVRPALAALAGRAALERPRLEARLACQHRQRGDRPSFFPSRLWEQSGSLIVEPLGWRGSADLATLAQADALAFFPAGRPRFEPGEIITVVRFRAQIT